MFQNLCDSFLFWIVFLRCMNNDMPEDLDCMIVEFSEHLDRIVDHLVTCGDVQFKGDLINYDMPRSKWLKRGTVAGNVLEHWLYNQGVWYTRSDLLEDADELTADNAVVTSVISFLSKSEIFEVVVQKRGGSPAYYNLLSQEAIADTKESFGDLSRDVRGYYYESEEGQVLLKTGLATKLMDFFIDNVGLEVSPVQMREIYKVNFTAELVPVLSDAFDASGVYNFKADYDDGCVSLYCLEKKD